MVYIKLVPVHGADETLVEGFTERPCLEWKPNVPIRLGRNHSTKVSEVAVSRNLAEISANCGRAQLRILKSHEMHRLQLRGQRVTLPVGSVVELQDQDRLALYGDKYEYVVLITNDNEATTSSNAATNLVNTTAAAQSHVATANVHSNCPRTEMAEEVLCSVCMDILVDATTVVPCGHTFCRSCLNQLQQCPNCRQKVQHGIPSRKVDNVVWNMVRQQYFQPDDVDSYLTRSNRIVSDNERQLLMYGPPRKRQRTAASNQQEEESQETVVFAGSQRSKTTSGQTAEDAICLD